MFCIKYHHVKQRSFLAYVNRTVLITVGCFTYLENVFTNDTTSGEEIDNGLCKANSSFDVYGSVSEKPTHVLVKKGHVHFFAQGVLIPNHNF